MNLAHTSDKEFIQRLTEIVEANLGDENFGVKELVSEAGMSQYLIKQRLKAISKQNINQFIREVRLHKAMEMLQQGTLTVSEVAYTVGFSSATYFNNCFHDFYGYPPGEVKRRVPDRHEEGMTAPVSPKWIKSEEGNERQLRKKIKWKTVLYAASVIVLIGIISYLGYNAWLSTSAKFPGNLLKNREKSIVVLPFVNQSGDEENQYFADGVMEDILTNLSHIRELKVISRTSAEQFRGTAKSTPEIARILGVNYILEGSVQRHDDKVRVRVQFIDARNDHHLISETYDRGLSDIFTIQSDIARQVAAALQATLSAKETGQINKVPTSNIDAYNLYLMGRFFWNKRTKTDQLNSTKYFEKALSIDPGFALAYAGLADAYFILTWYQWFPRPEGFVKAKEMALKALELDNTLAEAHATLGWLLCWSEWKWEEARKELQLATRLNPNYANGHQYLAELSEIIGDRAGARTSITRAVELNPFSMAVNDVNGYFYYHEGKYKESLDAYIKVTEIQPDRRSAYFTIFLIHHKLGDEVKAIEAFQNYLAKDTISIKYINKVKDIYNKSGFKGLINLSIELELKKSDPDPFSLAEEYAMLGEKEKAINWLEKAIEKRYPTIPLINYTPSFKDLHSEPRFQALINQMGLAQYLSE